MKKIHRYKKIVSAIGLAAYLFICGYFLFHYHDYNYLLNEAFSVPDKTVTDSKFHYNGFCLLQHFNANQLLSDGNPFPHIAPANFYLTIYDYTSAPLISDTNSIQKRGPPSLS